MQVSTTTEIKLTSDEVKALIVEKLKASGYEITNDNVRFGITDDKLTEAVVTISK